MNKFYEIIIGDDSKRIVWKVDGINEILTALVYNADIFIPEGKPISWELMTRKIILELANEIIRKSCKKEPYITYGKRYCDILNKIKNIKKIEECTPIFSELNKLIKEIGENIEFILEESEDDEFDLNEMEGDLC